MLRRGPNPIEPRPDSSESRKPSQNSEDYPSTSSDCALGKSVAESAAISREIREGILSAFVGGTASITGAASFKTLLRVDGTFSGRISSDEGMLMVAASGRVEADVTVAVAIIQGTLIGDVVATDRIELGPTARVTGNIVARSLIVQTGAMLEGSCRMSSPYALPEPAPVPDQPPAVESESVPGPASATERPAVAEASTAPDIETATVETSSVPAPEIAVEQETATGKPPKVERKQNVLVSKPKRSRAKVAGRKVQDNKTDEDDEAAKAMTG